MTTDPISFSERAERKRRGLPIAEVERDPAEDALRMLSSFDPVFLGIAAGEWKNGGDREDGLPADCPVMPLGWDGDGFHYLSGRGHLHALGENAGKGNIDALFTPYANFPVWAWPRKQKGAGGKMVVKGNFEAEEARKDLFKACAHAGPYDPMKKVRGRGAWRDRRGGLVLHLGTHMIVGGAIMRAGVVHDEKAYPVGPALPPPAQDAFGPGEDLPGAEIFNHLLSWNWARREVDARLELGWIAAAMVGGALDWRPYVFATGDAGSGKSTLIKYVMHVLGGEDAVLKPEDATEAGVAQTLGVDSLPVLLDEAENEADDKRAEKLIRLARRAASGNQRLRGGADGKSTLSVIRSPFHFSAINMPTMGDQDLSRMALLAMQPITGPKKRTMPWSDWRSVTALGRALHRQMIDWFEPDENGLAGFDRVLLAFRAGLQDEGDHDERGADTFGYLLAGYWCATHLKDPDPEDISELVAPMHRATLAELENIKPGWKKILDFMLDCQPKALERARWKSVRQVLLALRDGSETTDDDELDPSSGRPSPAFVNEQLGKVGLKLKWRRGQAKSFENAVLFVPNSNPALAGLFEKTRWSVSDPSDAGNWQYALRGGPATIVRAGKASGREPRGTLIKICEVMGQARHHDEDEE